MRTSLLMLWLAGCPSDPEDSDAPRDTEAPEDTDGVPDTDTDVEDTDDTDVEDTDVEDTDVEDTDTGFEPNPDCDYGYWEETVAWCGGEWTSIWEMVDYYYPEECPPYYMAGDESFETFEDAVAGRGCADECLYSAATAVMVLYCGYRGEYIDYRPAPDDGSCVPLIHATTCAGSAWTPTWEEYQEAFLCEDHVDTCPEQ